MESTVITFGCRLNACESEIIDGFVKELGLSRYTIINTCAVTSEAERQLRQTIRRLFKEDNSVNIILTGCAAKLHPDLYMAMDGVVGIISNDRKLLKSEYEKYICNEKRHNNPEKSEFAEKKLPKKVRGFLQIQNGCDQKCTYCVVRITRGPNISYSEDDIITQAKKLLERGYRDIILTGVNISAYGRDMNPRRNLAYIIDHLLKNVPELRRLGLSSLDPADIDMDLIDLIVNEERLLPHVHESIQSGDNLILKRMMRRHSREQVIETNSRILSKRPDVVFGADIICGFPTETEMMFENTKRLMVEAHISLLHAFPFSKRPGTPAALMPAVDKSVAKRRVHELKSVCDHLLEAKMREYIGREVIVLAEEPHSAKTNSFLKVKTIEKMEIGCEYRVKCEKIDGDWLVGSVTGSNLLL